MEKLKVGIAGYGVVGARRHQYIDQNPHLKTVAVCDVTFKERAPVTGLKCFSNYQQLLEEDLDVLFVCLPNDLAPEVTIAGLRKGLHIFCEKPPGRDLNDIASVMRAEKEAACAKLMYGFNHRYHDSVIEALRLVRGGDLGRIVNMRGVYGKSKIISFQSSWRTKRAVAGGGILLDQGIHMVDLMRMFAGEFEEIHSFVDNGYWNHDVEDNAYALMKTKAGVVAFLHSTATQWRHRFNLEITLERGAIILSGILSGSKSYGAEQITVAYRSDRDEGDPREVTTRYNEDKSWEREIEVFADCVVNKKPIDLGRSEEAFKTMELVYRIYCADPKWRQKFKLTDRATT